MLFNLLGVFTQKNIISLMSSVKESGAVALLTRAVELDNEGRCDEALSCYQSGIEQLMTVMKGLQVFHHSYLPVPGLRNYG